MNIIRVFGDIIIMYECVHIIIYILNISTVQIINKKNYIFKISPKKKNYKLQMYSVPIKVNTFIQWCIGVSVDVHVHTM